MDEDHLEIMPYEQQKQLLIDYLRKSSDALTYDQVTKLCCEITNLDNMINSYNFLTGFVKNLEKPVQAKLENISGKRKFTKKMPHIPSNWNRTL